MKTSGGMNTSRRCRIVFGFLYIMILYGILCPGSATAHRIIVFAWVEGDTVHTESKFSGGKRVSGGEVLVYGLNGKQLLTGKTNTKGEFSFKIPQKAGMKIVIQAGMGHRGEWTIPQKEMEPQQANPEPAVSQKQPAGSTEVNGAASFASLDEFREVLEESLDRKLNPIIKTLAENRDRGPSLRDILGGIGYVLGLLGLAAYMQFRRKAGNNSRKDKG